MTGWQKSVIDEWERRQAAQQQANQGGSPYTLIEQTFDSEEILAMMDVVLSGQLTMSRHVREFEKKFAEFVGAPYAVMVNSGSSANLLALAVATNPLRERRLTAGDEVLVPAVCWSTSVWPLVQMGLKPVFVDVDPLTLNVDIESFKRALTPKTRGLMAVHILGNCAPMDEMLVLAKQNDLIVIEDTCESLGSTWKGKALGALGEMGTYSFYFSHHMTTGEGGMVVAQTQEDYDLLKCLRAHGWTRELSNKAELEARYSHVDPRFLFVNVGYNLRPMEIQAALGVRQLEKLPRMNQNRLLNWSRLREALQGHAKWQGQFVFPHAVDGAAPVWFGFPLLLADNVQLALRDYLNGLSAQGVENRPVVSGNFARQPGLELFGVATDWRALSGAERVHQRGFFIGLHARELANTQIKDLANRLMYFV